MSPLPFGLYSDAAGNVSVNCLARCRDGDKALLIALGYGNPASAQAADVKPLNTTYRDALSLERYLVDRGYPRKNITVITDVEASSRRLTRDEIVRTPSFWLYVDILTLVAPSFRKCGPSMKVSRAEIDVSSTVSDHLYSIRCRGLTRRSSSRWSWISNYQQDWD
jgi:hypothetical protein